MKLKKERQQIKELNGETITRTSLGSKSNTDEMSDKELDDESPLDSPIKD